MKISKTENQGISGQVLWHEGNQMPAPNAVTDTADGQPVQRLVYIFERTKTSDATPSKGPIYDEINTNLVKVVPTDHLGRFKVVLPPGEYSLFTKEDNGFFANQVDSDNNINLINVKSKQFTPITIDINYKASY